VLPAESERGDAIASPRPADNGRMHAKMILVSSSIFNSRLYCSNAACPDLDES
jgi:hypothetical protein